MWQRTSPGTDTIHSYGGLRLWPTARDYSTMTAQQLRLTKIKGVQYVKEIGSSYQPLDVVYLSYNDQYADQKFDALKQRYPNVKHVKDVKGIFEAHQAAWAGAVLQ